MVQWCSMTFFVAEVTKSPTFHRGNSATAALARLARFVSAPASSYLGPPVKYPMRPPPRGTTSHTKWLLFLSMGKSHHIRMMTGGFWGLFFRKPPYEACHSGKPWVVGLDGNQAMVLAIGHWLISDRVRVAHNPRMAWTVMSLKKALPESRFV